MFPDAFIFSCCKIATLLFDIELFKKNSLYLYRDIYNILHSYILNKYF